MLRTRSARVLDDYQVQLTLTNGDVVERDLTDIIWGPVFQPLLDDYTRFRQLQVEAGTITWPGDLDFDPDTLIWGGSPPTKAGARPERFLKLPRRSPSERIRAFHEKLDQPSIVGIDGATAYWLEGEDGRQIGEQSHTSEAPLLAALAEIQRGADPIELSLVCNAADEGAPDDGRYVISTGIGLLWMAESAAGLPPRPRGLAAAERPITRKPTSVPAASPASGSRRHPDR